MTELTQQINELGIAIRRHRFPRWWRRFAGYETWIRDGTLGFPRTLPKGVTKYRRSCSHRSLRIMFPGMTAAELDRKMRAVFLELRGQSKHDESREA